MDDRIKMETLDRLQCYCVAQTLDCDDCLFRTEDGCHINDICFEHGVTGEVPYYWSEKTKEAILRACRA